jgi:pimeloyl-ACP methyl ester carboxylesterase
MWRQIVRDGVRIAVFDWREQGEPVVFLHGIAGHANEWGSAAGGLPRRLRPVALEQRGHGRSERRPTDVSPTAYIADVKAVIDEQFHAPVHLIGQSFGGHIAFLFAASHPELVRSLVVIEASPSGPNPGSVSSVRNWLLAWPRPFTSRQQAAEFFGGPPHADAWVDGLEARDRGLWPQFDDDVLLAALGHLAAQSWWDDWKKVTCRSLIVFGEKSIVSAADVDRMSTTGPHPEAQVVAHAGHDVHLDQPEALAALLTSYLTERTGP